MSYTSNMDQSEMEGKDRQDPTVNRSRRGDIRILEHAFNVLCIDFYDEVPTSDQIYLVGSQSTVESIDLQLGLRELGFSLVECDRTKSGIESELRILRITLTKDESDSDVGSVDRKDDRGIRFIVYGSECRGIQ